MAIHVSGVRNYDARAFSYRAQSEERRIATSRIGAKRERKALRTDCDRDRRICQQEPLHLYGKGRPTTPKMESLSSKKAFFLTTLTCSTRQFSCLSRALTRYNRKTARIL
jgi:hypothetical protein